MYQHELRMWFSTKPVAKIREESCECCLGLRDWLMRSTEQPRPVAELIDKRSDRNAEVISSSVVHHRRSPAGILDKPGLATHLKDAWPAKCSEGDLLEAVPTIKSHHQRVPQYRCINIFNSVSVTSGGVMEGAAHVSQASELYTRGELRHVARQSFLQIHVNVGWVTNQSNVCSCGSIRRARVLAAGARSSACGCQRRSVAGAGRAGVVATPGPTVRSATAVGRGCDRWHRPELSGSGRARRHGSHR